MTTNLRLAKSLAHKATVHREGEHPDGGVDLVDGRWVLPPSEKERQRRRAHYLASLAKRKAKKRKGRAA